MRKLSAKDRAFDKERQKLNKEIRMLSRQIEHLQEENSKYREQLMHQDTKLNEYKDRIDRLLEYIDKSELPGSEIKKLSDMTEIFTSFRTGKPPLTMVV